MNCMYFIVINPIKYVQIKYFENVCDIQPADHPLLSGLLRFLMEFQYELLLIKESTGIIHFIKIFKAFLCFIFK